MKWSLREKLIIISPRNNFHKVRTTKSLGHGLFPKIIFYFWEYFFEYTSLIPLKKFELP